MPDRYLKDFFKGDDCLKLFKYNGFKHKFDVKVNNIKTPIGTIMFNLEIGQTNLKDISPYEVYKIHENSYISCWYTDDVDVELLISPFIPDLPKHLHVDGCYLGIWRIKFKRENKGCNFHAHWMKGYKWITGGYNGGEDLEGQTWDSENLTVSLGTHDGERLLARSITNDFMPINFESNTDAYNIINHKPNGLVVQLKSIRINEICQMHFVVSWSKKKENDVSTWYAVDQSNRNLLRVLGIE